MKETELPLLSDLLPEDLNALRTAGVLSTRRYTRGTFLLRAGDRTTRAGIVLTGQVLIEGNDAWGNRSIFAPIGEGQIFGESYALTGEVLLVDAVCCADTAVLWLDLAAMTAPANAGAAWSAPFLRRLLTLTAGKNFALSRRMFCTSPRSMRVRIMTYLTGEAARQGSRSFTVPLDRARMADYLNLDRSALSRELSRMQKAGILRYRKNAFTLLTPLA